VVRAALAVVIMAAAVFLRFWRISWALTEGTWFPDEVLWAHSASLFTPLSWQAFVDGRHLRLPYPAGYAILSGLSLATAKAIAFSPLGGGDADAILIARLVAAAAGVATVALVGRFARRLDGPAVGLAAAALMAVVPLHAMQSHYASSDVLHTLAVALVMVAGCTVAMHGTRSSALAMGAAAGLAFGTKYNGLAMLASGGIVIADLAIRRRSVEQAIDLGVWMVAGFVVAACLACPPCVLDPGRVVDMWRWQWSFKPRPS
jgi:4-amino-4-deoxy-L-arabinose transferase-like glycosyltransferase